MNRRPKIWIHRTKRFWWGLVILLLLQGAWIFAAYRGVWVFCGGPSAWNDGSLAVERGGLEFFLHRTDPAPSFSSYIWHVSPRWFSGIQVEPEFSWRTQQPWGSMGDVLTVRAFLPGWIPILIWIPWWLLWIRRGDKVEDAIAAQAQVIQVGDQDPA